MEYFASPVRFCHLNLCATLYLENSKVKARKDTNTDIRSRFALHGVDCINRTYRLGGRCQACEFIFSRVENECSQLANEKDA